MQKKKNLFQNNKFIYLIFVSLFLIFITNILLFIFGSINIDSIWFVDKISRDNLKWLGISEIFLSGISSSLTIYGVILTIRNNKFFIYPLIIGEILVIFDSLIIGAFFAA